MKTTSMYPFVFDPFRIWTNYAWKMGELTLASSQVISQRSRLFWSGRAPTAADQRELALMSQEKYAAAAESAQAVALGYVKFAPQLAVLALRQLVLGSMPLTAWMTLNPFQLSSTASETFARSASAANQVSRSMENIASRGLKPVHTRAVANARRLKRRTR